MTASDSFFGLVTLATLLAVLSSVLLLVIGRLFLRRQIAKNSQHTRESVLYTHWFSDKAGWKVSLCLLLFVMLLTFIFYVFMTQIGARDTQLSAWQNQTDFDGYDVLADELLSGKRDAPDARFYDVATQQTSRHQTSSTSSGEVGSGKVRKEEKDEYAEQQLVARTARLVAVLQTKAHQQPQNSALWQRLAHIYTRLENMTAARDSLAHAYRVDPENTAIALAYARISLRVDKELTPTVRKVLEKILHTNPAHEGAQMLMGMGELAAGNHAAATYWLDRLKQTLSTKQQSQLAEASEARESVANLQRQAYEESLAQLATLSQLIANGQYTNQTEQFRHNRGLHDDNGITLKLSVAHKLYNDLSLLQARHPQAKAYVTALPKTGIAYASKAVDLASLLQAGKDGIVLTLSDSDALLPSRTLSVAKRDRIPLFLFAHISQSGNAIAKTGDLASSNVPFNVSNASPETDKANSQSNANEHVIIDLTMNQRVS